MGPYALVSTLLVRLSPVYVAILVFIEALMSCKKAWYTAPVPIYIKGFIVVDSGLGSFKFTFITG